MTAGGAGISAFTVVVLLHTSNLPRAAGGKAGPVRTALARRGYARSGLDSGWVAHERSVPKGSLAAEWRLLRRLLEAL